MILVRKYNARNWAIYRDGELLAVTVYKKGALAVAAAILDLKTRPAADVIPDLYAANRRAPFHNIVAVSRAEFVAASPPKIPRPSGRDNTNHN